MLSVLGFLAILGPLVIVHELGHFLFARLFRVKAEVFSIGFGPRLISKQWGETEFRWALVPMGGYVKLLGEDPEVELSPEDAPRALQKQAAWKRFLIFFGGPLFNFLFAIVVYMAILAIGEPHVASRIGRVVRNSAAEKAGLVSGDRILTVNGANVRKFEEVIQVINDSPNRSVQLVVERGAESPRRVEISVTPTEQEGFSVYGEATQVGELEGLLPNDRNTQVGVSDSKSPAGLAGLKTGDVITAVNGKPVDAWEQVELAVTQVAPGTNFELSVRPLGARETEIKKVSFTRPTVGDWSEALGLRSSELFIEKAVPDSPALKAGLQPGDRIIGIGDQVVQSFLGLRDAVQRAGEAHGKVLVKWERDGKEMSAEIVPTATQGRDPMLKKTVQYTVGIVPQLVWAENEMVTERIWNPFLLLYKGTERMVTFTYRNVMTLVKMVSGDVSVGTLGGPILIGKLAGESLSRGLVAFLSMMAMLSIGLGVLNLLPVPVLDGGHLVLLGIESVRGRPLTLRQMEIIQQVGLSLILLLMVIVMRNDLARLSIFN